jgi:hypothetical protein
MSAPKQIAKRQKLERKRLRKRETRLKRQRKRQTSWYRPDCFGPVAMLNAPVGGVKMSEVMGDFVAPMADPGRDRVAYERLLSLGQVAWNVALEPEHRREAMIDDMIEAGLPWGSPWELQACRDLVHRLVARKLESFAKYQRPILAFQLDELEDGGYYLSVASALFR